MITLFLGSGASPLPCSSVGEITAAALTAHMELDSRQCFMPLPVHGIRHSPYSVVVPRLLSRLQQDIARVKGIDPGVVTYEQIAAVCIELDTHWSQARSPAVDEYWHRLDAEFGPLVLSESPDPVDDPFSELVDHAVSWIRRVVELELTTPSRQADITTAPLTTLLHVVANNSPAWSVVTLNHDLMIEQSLLQSGLTFHDGFSCREGVLEFDPDILRRGTQGALLKLHGSVDWRWHADRKNYIKHQSGDDHTDAWRARPEAEILFGDFTKMEDYNYGIFSYLFAAFDRVLALTTRLIVCGFGFQDHGVNLRLLNELRYRQDISVLLIHPHPRKLIETAPFHTQRDLTRWMGDGKIQLLQGYLHESLQGNRRDQLLAFIRGS